MIIGLTLDRDKNTQKILNKQSEYDPSDAVKERTAEVLKDFGLADEIRNKPYPEFNFESLIDRLNLDQSSYNQFPGTRSQDPAEAWKSLAFRPIVRNKIISIAAHITASIIYPKVYAQNDRDEEDRDGAQVMRDIMEWVADKADYDKTFLYSVIAALVNPAAVIHTEFAERYREIKVMKADGTWDVKEVLDELFSGFQDALVPVDELWISNMYEHNIQKQPFLIWRKVLDFATAKAKYGDRTDFKYVKPGIQYLYAEDQNLFYEQFDESLQGRLVEEVIYYNRSADLQIAFLNGVLLDHVDQPNPRQDKLYPFVKGGYELFDDGRFFYYKSLAFKMANDEEVVNTAYRMVVDGTYLQIMPPAVVFGSDDINSTIIAPGVVTTLSNEDGKAAFQTIQTNNNLTAGYNLIEKVEGSLNESSADVLQSGQASGGDQTAYEISKLDQNARVMLGLFGKMIGFMVKDFGELRIGDIVQHLTVGEATDLLSTNGKMKFAKFILPEKTINGKTKTRRIEFDMGLPDEVTDDELMNMSQEIDDEERDLDDDVQIYKVNPTLFRKLKFKLSIQPEAITPKSDALKKALSLEAYGLAIANPLVNVEAVTRDLLFGAFDTTKDDPERYMKKPEEMQQGMPGMPGAPGAPQAGGQDVMGAIAADEGQVGMQQAINAK